MALGFTCGVGSRNPRRPFPHVQHWWQRSKIVASPWWTHWSSTTPHENVNKELTLQGRRWPYLDLPFKVLQFCACQDPMTSLHPWWDFDHWPYVFSRRSSFVSLADVNIVEIIDSPATLINFSSVGKTLEKSDGRAEASLMKNPVENRSITDGWYANSRFQVVLHNYWKLVWHTFSTLQHNRKGKQIFVLF